MKEKKERKLNGCLRTKNAGEDIGTEETLFIVNLSEHVN